MKTRRTHAVITGLLAALLVAASIYVLVLRQRVERATRFAQDGATSVVIICSLIAEVGETRSDNDVEFREVAKTCLGRLSMEEAQRLQDELREQSRRNAFLAKRIREAMAVRRLPYRDVDDLRNDLLPEGLRD